MYELHLHLLLLVGAYLKLLNMLQMVPSCPEIKDISGPLTDTRTFIMEAIAAKDSGWLPQNFETIGEELHNMRKEDAVKVAVECVCSESYSKALQLLHSMRYHE